MEYVQVRFSSLYLISSDTVITAEIRYTVNHFLIIQHVYFYGPKGHKWFCVMSLWYGAMVIICVNLFKMCNHPLQVHRLGASRG